MENKFECKFCRLVYKFQSSLSRHLHWKHLNPKVYECITCESKFDTSEGLLQHFKGKTHNLLKKFLDKKNEVENT